MTEKKSQGTRLVIIIAVFSILAIALSAGIQKAVETPSSCARCHEMYHYVRSYEGPPEGSTIDEHDLNCIECHTNTSQNRARGALVSEIEAAVLTRITGIRFGADLSALAVNCTRCHVMTDLWHQDMTNGTNCQSCHWAHWPRETEGLRRSIIPSGPHKNKTCQDCHGIDFSVPRCLNCHPGHGEQKLENGQCLACHFDPHVPLERPNRTSIFKEKLPFSVCEPCHEDQYFELVNSFSLHTENQTCISCHDTHGNKPMCVKCHTGHPGDLHPDYFQCSFCHKPEKVKVPCLQCHGRTHDWSALTAELRS